MAHYTIDQAAKMLHCSSSTVRNWLKKANIDINDDSRKSGRDGRKHWIDDEDIAVLNQMRRDEFEQQSSSGNTAPVLLRAGRRPEDLAEVFSRLEALESAMRDIRSVRSNRPARQDFYQSGWPSTSTATLTIDRPVKQITQGGAVSFREAGDIAVIHGANSAPAATSWRWDDRSSLQAVLLFARNYLISHPRAGIWHECDDSECPCHHLDEN